MKRRRKRKSELEARTKRKDEDEEHNEENTHRVQGVLVDPFTLNQTVELKRKETLSLEGVVKITVLQGCLWIEGYLLTATKGSVVVSGNQSVGWPLTCKPVFRDGEYNGPEHPERCLIFLDNVQKDKCSGIAYTTAEKSEEDAEQKNLKTSFTSKKTKKTKKTFEHKVLEREENALNLQQDWQQCLAGISEELLESLGSAGSSLSELTTLVCGPKNAGKSSFCRTLVNTLLNSSPVVAYLEADCGQPEFNLPGSVSLTFVDTAVAGPPFMHPRKAAQACFIGDTTPKSDPVLYLNSVLYLVEWYRTRGTQALKDHLDARNISVDHLVPLVINTPGWVKGLGFEILDRIVQQVRPNHVVELCTNTAKDLPKEESGWKDNLGLRIHYLQAHKFSAPNGVSALDVRSLMWLSFSHQCTGLPFDLNAWTQDLFSKAASSLCSCIPYRVNLSSVRVTSTSNFEFPDKLLPNVLNGSLVALSNLSLASSDGRSQNSCFPFIGFGLVRAVDSQSGDLYILTNVVDVEQAEMLLLGSVRLPQQLMQNGIFQSPYVAEGAIAVEGTGSGTIKGRNNMRRGRLD